MTVALRSLPVLMVHRSSRGAQQRDQCLRSCPSLLLVRLPVLRLSERKPLLMLPGGIRSYSSERLGKHVLYSVLVAIYKAVYHIERCGLCVPVDRLCSVRCDLWASS